MITVTGIKNNPIEKPDKISIIIWAIIRDVIRIPEYFLNDSPPIINHIAQRRIMKPNIIPTKFSELEWIIVLFLLKYW